MWELGPLLMEGVLYEIEGYFYPFFMKAYPMMTKIIIRIRKYIVLLVSTWFWLFFFSLPSGWSLFCEELKRGFEYEYVERSCFFSSSSLKRDTNYGSCMFDYKLFAAYDLFVASRLLIQPVPPSEPVTKDTVAVRSERTFHAVDHYSLWKFVKVVHTYLFT